MGCGSLLEATQNLLLARPRSLTYEQIVAECPSLNLRWLSCLANGQIKDPGVNKIQCLYEYLARKPLPLA